MGRTARYWLPILGVFTGARLNELCQLLVEDVDCDDGIHFLNITNEGENQRVKNRSSKRKMPIHDGLVSLGFLEFVRHQRQAGETRLFPELKLSEYGYYSEDFSKWFSRYLKQIGIKTDKVSFHSLRHCFEDACRTALLEGGIMDALQGHTEAGQRGRYGKGFTLATLNVAVQKLDHFPQSLMSKT
jgi:integrase